MISVELKARESADGSGKGCRGVLEWGEEEMMEEKRWIWGAGGGGRGEGSEMGRDKKRKKRRRKRRNQRRKRRDG